MHYLCDGAPAHILPHELKGLLLSIALDNSEDPSQPADDDTPLQGLKKDGCQQNNLVKSQN